MPKLSPTPNQLEYRLIITNNNDTVRGKVNVTLVVNYVMRIQFKDNLGRKFKYKAGEIKEFGQKRQILLRLLENDLTTVDKEWAVYETQIHPKQPDKPVFMERLLNGSQIKIYNNPTGMKSGSMVGDIKVRDKDYSYIIIKHNAPPLILRSINFDEEYFKLFGDCPTLMDFIKQNNVPVAFRNLGVLVEQYNLRCSK